MDAVSEKTMCTVMIQNTLHPAIKTEQLNHRIVSEYLNTIQYTEYRTLSIYPAKQTGRLSHRGISLQLDVTAS